jgi:hypothetical protein
MITVHFPALTNPLVVLGEFLFNVLNGIIFEDVAF